MAKSKSKRKHDLAYKYMGNLAADIRLIGFPAVLNPFAQHTSSSRMEMFRAHIGQAMIPDGGEFPHIWTGKEMDTARYEVNGTSRENDAQVIRVIPKYPVRSGDGQITENPTRTVIFQDYRTGELDYINLDQYYMGADGFGYEAVMENEHLLLQDTHLPKDAVLAHSPARQGNKYCLGVNANVAYMTLPDTIEDAMVISRSLADKMTTTEISKVTISVRANEHPISHFSRDGLDYKFLLDIGEYVGDDGVLFASRNVDTATFASDMQPDDIWKMQWLYDRVIRVPPGSKIVDLDFYVTSRRDQIPWSVYGQAEKYIEAIKTYWSRIIEVYEQYRDTHKITPKFSSLVTKAYLHLSAHGGRVKGVSNRRVRFINRADQPVEFFQIEVTYLHKRTVQLGTKITDRHGTKGVICRIADDEDMPVDEYGIRADLVVDPGSIISRMNLGHPHEQAVNRVSEFVRRQVEHVAQDSIGKAGDLLLDYYNDINPYYREIVQETRNTPQAMDHHVRDVIKNGIHLWIPPFLETFYDDDFKERSLAIIKAAGHTEKFKQLCAEWDIDESTIGAPSDYKPAPFKYLQDKWKVPITHVTYTTMDHNGKPFKDRSERPVCIGSKYMYVLCKIPEPSSPGVAHVSHYGVPMKTPSDARSSTAISSNPTRFGEDEWRIAEVDVDSMVNFRLMCLQSASPAGVEKIVETLLWADKPTQIEKFDISDQTLRDTNSVLGLFSHMMSTQGIDVTNTSVTRDDFPDYMDIDNTGIGAAQTNDDDPYSEDDKSRDDDDDD